MSEVKNESLSEYERIRLENINRNDKFLKQIGLSTSSTTERSNVERKKRAAQEQDAESNKKRKTSSDGGDAVPVRRSTRDKKPVDHYVVDEDMDSKRSSSKGPFKPSAVKKSRSGGGGDSVSASTEVKIFGDKVQPIPKKNASGELVFPDYPNFRPNLTPKEVLQMGSFGGTYFRPITSGVTGLHYEGVWKELPEDWLTGLNIKMQVSSVKYNVEVNRYKESCGGDLDMWESSGWIAPIDPYGWFQWYCRFYQGRRTSDDERQISRGNGVMGPKGRWRNALVNKCLASGLPLEEASENMNISPKIRQLLQHWGYKLTVADLKAASRRK